MCEMTFSLCSVQYCSVYKFSGAFTLKVTLNEHFLVFINRVYQTNHSIWHFTFESVEQKNWTHRKHDFSRAKNDNDKRFWRFEWSMLANNLPEFDYLLWKVIVKLFSSSEVVNFEENTENMNDILSLFMSKKSSKNLSKWRLNVCGES